MKRPKVLTVRFDIRMSPADKQIVAEKAREAGLSATDWIRMRLGLDQTTRYRPADSGNSL